MRLTEITLLQDLHRPEMAPVRKLFSSRKFARGALVFEPRAGDQIFIVTSGRARVYLAYRDKEFTMAMLDAGDVYATHTRAYVQALDDLEILIASVSEVRRYLGSMPSFNSAMIHVLGDLLSHAISVIDTLAFKDVRNRLIEFLVYEARRLPRCRECRHCGQCEDGGMVSLGLNTEQMATIIGSSRQTVSSLLNALAKDGVIQLKGRGVICIPDIAVLEACAALEN
ncbi:CRP-like cAMP-binding protein [Desulfomicrobium macestii]|uniref:cAMP-binding domain of CRP or a regulatory subunit of cAMP-dependent protein kinases n=2 Tax=Desulfomicrobium TaxID=898 RepID=A0A8G2C3Q8_DESNO|nr:MULTISPECIES: Crp/Fnr family transcriptional regulator [Desulfomicrobium]MBE1424893.1 CRP-like cAMP-binding protein [Desulfomicrobium macestii]SFL84017.1 cAMP-binding domain of CRP or a regulatory subunit of cAMP-dependent protein kinases [Desulfomicrobium norvegicum]